MEAEAPEATRDIVLDALAELAGQDRASISASTLLYTDAASDAESLGLDSLDMLKLSLALVETLGVATLPEDGWEEIVTVGDLVAFCESAINGWDVSQTRGHAGKSTYA